MVVVHRIQLRILIMFNLSLIRLYCFDKSIDTNKFKSYVPRSVTPLQPEPNWTGSRGTVVRREIKLQNLLCTDNASEAAGLLSGKRICI